MNGKHFHNNNNDSEELIKSEFNFPKVWRRHFEIYSGATFCDIVWWRHFGIGDIFKFPLSYNCHLNFCWNLLKADSSTVQLWLNKRRSYLQRIWSSLVLLSWCFEYLFIKLNYSNNNYKILWTNHIYVCRYEEEPQ